MSWKKSPLINSLPKCSPSVLTGAAFVPTRGIPSGNFILSCYLFQTHIAIPFGILLRNKSCHHVGTFLFLPYEKVEAIVLPKGGPGYR